MIFFFFEPSDGCPRTGTRVSTDGPMGVHGWADGCPRMGAWVSASGRTGVRKLTESVFKSLIYLAWKNFYIL